MGIQFVWGTVLQHKMALQSLSPSSHQTWDHLPSVWDSQRWCEGTLYI